MQSKPNRALLREVSRSLGANSSLIPVLGELFASLTALGSSPRRLASLLPVSSLVARFSEPGLSSQYRPHVLDLACGKGAVSVELARRHGCRVTCVDGCPAFIVAARALAARHNVAHLCSWHIADIRRWSPMPSRKFDTALMIGLDSLADAVPRLRAFVRPGGFYLIDDAIRDPRHRDSDAFSDVPDSAACTALIESLGDRVLRRVMLPRAVIKSQHHAISIKLASTTRTLAKRHPKLRKPLAEFLANQRDASKVLLGPLRPTLWLIERA